MLRKLDQSILAFWSTSPDERVFAYLVTFGPIVILLLDVAIMTM